ncbi:MAG: histidine kinase [Gammaproteobacteria bacterium]|nr:histidine kinase [Gammaproteobacteria bacterium]
MHKQNWQLVGLLLLLCALSILSFSLLQQQGVNATVVVCLSAVLLVIGQILRLWLKQKNLPEQLFRALANGDNTLGLPADHPLRQHFEQARIRMQQARMDAEHQAQFLRQVLLHIDLALLICDAQGTISEQSPAAARLLGQKFATLQDIQHQQVLNQQALNQQLEQPQQPALAKVILNASTAQQTTVTWHRGEQPDTLAVAISAAVIAGQPMKIVTLQSIHQSLNLREQQAYSQLTRVLTHEVANSITPLSSIAQSCQGLMPDGLCFAQAEDKADLQLALQTLNSRTAHLGQFIQDFRQVAAVPKPRLQPVALTTLVQQVYQLYTLELQQQQIDCQLELLDTRLVMVDSTQIEQVLINLLKNAIEAFAQQFVQQKERTVAPQIWLTVSALGQNQLMVEVRDNGPGVTKEAAPMIFVPFFSTKRQGSGIGLALARQIMVQHGGDLVYLPADTGARFRLLFG